MNEADQTFDQLAERLRVAARALVAARRAGRRRRWRDARLLWPLFAKD